MPKEDIHKFFNELKNRTSPSYLPHNQKISYFLEKFAKILENDNFVNFFAEILIRTKNINKVQEIINFLQSQLKLSDEHLLKILLSFIHLK